MSDPNGLLKGSGAISKRNYVEEDTRPIPEYVIKALSVRRARNFVVVAGDIELHIQQSAEDTRDPIELIKELNKLLSEGNFRVL